MVPRRCWSHRHIKHVSMVGAGMCLFTALCCLATAENNGSALTERLFHGRHFGFCLVDTQFNFHSVLILLQDYNSTSEGFPAAKDLFHHRLSFSSKMASSYGSLVREAIVLLDRFNAGRQCLDDFVEDAAKDLQVGGLTFIWTMYSNIGVIILNKN